jgi:thioredoxin reductase (NADPH)
MTDSNHDVIVIGAGITGLTAARQTLQSGMSTIVIECLMYGGLVININELDGETKGSGAELASGIMTAVLDLGGENVSATVASVRPEGDALVITTDAGTHRSRAVIVASGGRLKRLGVPGEDEFEYKGVSHCADCDGPFYRGQDVMVVGGGDSALQAALVLAKACRQVHLVHRGRKFRAQQYLVGEVASRKNIAIHWNSVVQQVLGADAVHAVRVVQTDTGTNGDIACTGFFVYIGLEPASEFLPANVTRDVGGFVVTDAGLRTNLAGVLAAGAVRSGYGGLLTHSIAEGIAAAHAANAIIAA